MSSQLLEELRRAVDGEVLVSGDGRYDSVRLPWNRTVDPKPAVMVEAAGPEDVRVAVLAARAHGLPFAVQATGHGTVVACDGGLLLSTARMGEVQVDPESRIATAGPGALWSDVIAAAAPHQLAPLSGRANSVGVAGYTLGGGTGWLSRKHGFAADSVLWAEVVTAGGETLTASATEHPDLFWALRGGGGNFGVVTRLRFKLYPVAQVYAGMSWHPADRAAAVLDRYREWAGTEPDELNSAVLVQQVPPLPEVPEPLRGARVLAVRAFHLGPAERAERLLRPLLEAAGPPLLDRFGPAGFAEASQAAAGPPLPPMAVRDHLDLFRQVPDSALDAIVEAAADPGSPLAFAELRHWGGAMARPSPDAGPVGHPDLPFSVAAMAPYDRGHRPERVDAAMDRLVAALRPGASGSSFLNLLSDPARTETAYTAGSYRRLAGLKRVWDPDNFFHLNHNIPPG
jgi:FAD/FMN-containing dehydrogenase